MKEKVIEIMARAICRSYNQNPDYVHPVSERGSGKPLWVGCVDEAQAAIAALSAAGYRIVPEIPTDAMLKAGSNAYYGAPAPVDEDDVSEFIAAWRAMLSAVEDQR